MRATHVLTHALQQRQQTAFRVHLIVHVFLHHAKHPAKLKHLFVILSSGSSCLQLQHTQLGRGAMTAGSQRP